VSETACPFCRGVLGDAFRATPARAAPRARLTRAALFALGTGVAIGTAGCSSSSPASPGTGTEQGDGATGETADTGTGGSTDASGDALPGTGSSDAAGVADGPTAQPLYGAVAYDGGTEPEYDGGGAQPLYGATAHEDGGSFAALYGIVGH
jgi:hypothetical protein